MFVFLNVTKLGGLFIQADDLAAGLLALNLKQGDRVGIWGQNHMEWILVFLACAKAGLILVLNALLIRFK